MPKAQKHSSHPRISARLKRANGHLAAVIDMIADFPVPGLAASDFCGTLRKQLPRLYSIASSLRAHPAEVHLTIAIVRYHSHGRDREGVCSTYTADRVDEGGTMPVFLHYDKNFKLPEDGDTPIIMVGPGTGIAPFRAFVEERAATGAIGKSWLFFGDQHSATDYLYGDEWERCLADGRLSRIDLAFSRDQAEKVYVQHRMLEHSAELYSWLSDDAVFYVCGDASHMAHGVHEALITIEEGAVGGFGAHVAQLLADEAVFDSGLKFRSMVLPDTFINQASPADMYAVAAMNAPQIEAKVLEVLGVASIGEKRA